MSLLQCRKCSTRWYGNVLPTCPTCQSEAWATSPYFIDDKHDPEHLATTYKSFRSVLSHDFVNRVDEFAAYASASGSWYWDWEHRNHFHFTPEPLGTMPGSGVKPNETIPSFALNGLGVINAAGETAHAIAVDQADVRSDITAGVLTPVGLCLAEGCVNYAMLGEDYCAAHVDPPLADIVDAG